MSFNRTEQIDLLFTTTFQDRADSFADNVFNKQVLWKMMTANNRVDRAYEGGRQIELPIMVGENDTFKSVGKGGKVTVKPTDNETTTKWEWKTIIGSIVRYRADDFKNRGKTALINMVTQKIAKAELSAAKEMNRQIYLDGTGNGSLDMDGLQNIVAEDPTAAGDYPIVGGVPVSSVPVWQNQTFDATADDFADVGRARMVNMLNLCEDGGDMIDFIITSQELYELYETEVATIQQVIPSEGTRNKIADLGFRNLWFKEVPLVFDKHIPVADRMYFLNTDTLKLVGDRSIEWFEMTEWFPVAQQPKDRVAYIIWTGNLVSDNRRRNGVIFNFS